MGTPPGSTFFERVRAEGGRRTGPLSEEVVQAQETRLGVSVPEELRAFWLSVGAGEFRFGRVFSPATDDGSSELEDELWLFLENRDAASGRLRRLRSARLPEQLEFLPFCRSSSWLYLFDLAEAPAVSSVLSLAVDVLEDVPTPLANSFLRWAEESYPA